MVDFLCLEWGGGEGWIEGKKYPYVRLSWIL